MTIKIRKLDSNKLASILIILLAYMNNVPRCACVAPRLYINRPFGHQMRYAITKHLTIVSDTAAERIRYCACVRVAFVPLLSSSEVRGVGVRGREHWMWSELRACYGTLNEYELHR